MGFNGYFAKIGDYTIPNEYISIEGYEPLRAIQDMDSKRNGKGELKRNVLDHEIHTIEIDLRSMSNIEFDIIMGNIRENYSVPKERKATVTCFIAELGDYITADMYMPDIKIRISKMIDEHTLMYKPIVLEFISY